MVMVHPVVEPKACWEFEGDILILHHPTTISVKYQAMGNMDQHYMYRIILPVLHMVCKCGMYLNTDIGQTSLS